MLLDLLVIAVSGALGERAVPFHRHLFLVGVVGFLGSFTTFSTFGFETLELMRAGGQITWVVVNVCAQLLLGVGAVWLGRFAAHWLACSP